MKRKSLLFALLLALLVPWAASAQETVTIGDGTSTDYYTPIGTYYNYSITEQLYTAEEIGMAGTISSISFNYASSTAKDFPITVYMMQTDAENLSTGISLADADVVFEGTYSVTGSGWMTINLDAPFDYDGTSNLLIGINKGYVYYYSGGNWYHTSTSAVMARYTQNDNSAYDTSIVPGTTRTARPNIQMVITASSGGSECEKPETLTAVQPDTNPYHGVLLQWEGGSGTYNVQMKKSTETNDDWQTKAAYFTDNAFLINGLDAETTYNFRVQSVCYDNEGGDPGIPDLLNRDETTSGWKTVNYTTPIACPVPTQVTVSNITPYTADVTWTSDAETFNIMLGETVIEHCTSPYTLSNLTPATSYTVKVQAVCDDIDQSQWTSGTTFMTAEICPEGMVCIGTGTATSTYMPLNNYYKYSLTEQIYTAAEIGEAGAILSIDFFKAATIEAVKDLDIYIVSTNKTEFESNTDWIQVTASDLVYSGTVTFVDNDWTTIELDSPFIYDGVSNICIVVDNNTGSYKSSTAFRIFTASNNQTLYYQSDSNNLDPTTAISQSASGKTAQKNRIRLNIGEPPACPKPTGVTASDVTAHEATISWTSDASAWQIQLGEETAIDVTEATYTFTGLAPETTFAVKVRANCGGVYSEWANGSFTTTIACPAPTGLAATLTPGNGTVATLSWTSSASAWVVAYKTAEEEEFTEVNVTENPYTLNGLTPETAYTAKVKAVCGGEDGESQWSSTITFTPTNAYMITVNDGTTTNGYVPIYGYYCDDITKSQFIIPAASLEAMQWGTINKLTFYASNADVSWGSATFEVYMTETTETTLSTLADYTSMEKVMNVASLSINGNQMVVTLDAPYQYMGGNLMIGFLQITTGSYVTSNWYGVSATGASMGGNGSSISQRNFLPKTTFNYVPGEAPACPKPTGLTAFDVTAHEASVAWISDASAFEIQLGEDNVIPVNDTVYHFTGLAPETAFAVKVRANCGDAYSDWTNPVSFTTGIACPAPTVAVSNITPYTAEVNCTNTDAENFNVMLDTIVVAENVTMPYMLTDLTHSTTYTVKVQAICGGEDGESAYSNGTNFMTTEICPEGMVCIGTGTATNSYVPTYTYYNYSLTQQIYTAAEIGQAGEITSVDFYKSGTNGGARTLDIYMVSTEKETFSGATDWIAVTASDLVYSGIVTFANDAWTTIEFNAPFLYDGTTNVALIVDDNTGSYVSAPSFFAFDATSQAIRVYSDGTNYNVTAPSSYNGTVLNVKNRVRFAIGEPPACPKPTALAVNYEGGITATVTWEGDATSYNIDVNGTVTEGVTSPYTLDGLELATTYAVMVQANCGEDLSEWTNAVSFTTDLCMPENMCEITFALTDSYGDGWNGAYIEVVDVETETVLGQFTNTNDAEGGEAQTYTLAVCDGRELQFVWHSGSYDSEASYVVTNISGDVIFEGNGTMSEPVNYTVSCVVCPKPSAIVVSHVTISAATVQWNGSNDNYEIQYRALNGEWGEPIETENPSIRLTDLEPSTTYECQVRGYCASDEFWTDWTNITSFTTLDICAAPEILTVVPSFESATITWNGVQSEYLISWGSLNNGEVEYGTPGTAYDKFYTIEGLSSGQSYRVKVTGICGDGQYADSEEYDFNTAMNWTDPTTWEGVDDYSGQAGTAPEVINVPEDMTVVIPQNSVVEVNQIDLPDNSQIVIEEGSELVYSVEVVDPYNPTPEELASGVPVTMTMSFDGFSKDNSGYRLIASPIYETMSIEDCGIASNYDGMDLYSFDANYPRAEWRNYKWAANNFTNLEIGKGYLYYNNAPVFVTFFGQTIPSNVIYPIDLAWSENAYYDEWKGLNLVGNPFTCKATPDKDFYVLNDTGDEVLATASATGYVAPMKGFFVLATEAGQKCYMSKYVEPAANGGGAGGEAYFPEEKSMLNMTLSQNQHLVDRAAVKFGQGENLRKVQLNSNHTKIYMPLDGKDYAMLHGEETGEMPVNFKAEHNGSYTLSFTSQAVSFSYLHFIDNMTGNDVDLLKTPSYTFDARTSDYASRFRLVYATGSSAEGDNFGFVNAMGNLCIFGIEGEATLQVMDVTGRVLSSNQFSGSYESKLNVAPGVYMLRLINGNDVKVQKMIVK